MLPTGAAVAAVVSLILAQTGLFPLELALGLAVGGALVAVFALAAQPVLEGTVAGPARTGSVGFAALWLATLATPLLFRIFPGTPLLEHAAISGPSASLPLSIPTGGHGRLDIVTEGQLAEAPSGATIPVQYTFTIGTEAGPAETISGQFSEEVKTQRLGRRGSTTVHQQHTAAHHTVATGGHDNLTVTAATVEPANAPPVLLTVFPRRLPPWPIALAAGLGLLAAAIYLDRLPDFATNDGAFTFATGAVLGATYFFTTDNAAHPGIGTLIGAAFFGGGLGMAGSGLAWWISKRLAPAAG